MIKKINILIALISCLMVVACSDQTEYHDNEMISLICDNTWVSQKSINENGFTGQAKWNFKRNGTYIRTNIEIDKEGNATSLKITGQWAFADLSSTILYFGREHYWDIETLTKYKFTYYDRNGEFGDPFMSREYNELTSYNEF